MPKILDIVTIPAKSLRQPSQAVEVSQIGTPEFQQFCDDLIATMKVLPNAAGLAAPQVGRNVRVFAINDKIGAKIYINPEVELLSEAIAESEEGCFSVPDVWGIVLRAKKIRLKALDRHGRRIEIAAKGFPAFVLQHENDHLLGTLFIDKMIHVTKGENPKAI